MYVNRLRTALARMRDRARNVVLPVGPIRNCLKSFVTREGLPSEHPILDFGAGTLFWSKWLQAEIGPAVCAVDPKFARPPYDRLGGEGIRCFPDLEPCMAGTERFALAWLCDVLHHLPADFADHVVEHLTTCTDRIVIKDIDAKSRWGTFQNQVHDLVFSGQLARPVASVELVRLLEGRGFTCEVVDLPKIGYSHFLLTAVRR